MPDIKNPKLERRIKLPHFNSRSFWFALHSTGNSRGSGRNRKSVSYMKSALRDAGINYFLYGSERIRLSEATNQQISQVYNHAVNSTFKHRYDKD